MRISLTREEARALRLAGMYCESRPKLGWSDAESDEDVDRDLDALCRALDKILVAVAR